MHYCQDRVKKQWWLLNRKWDHTIQSMCQTTWNTDPFAHKFTSIFRFDWYDLFQCIFGVLALRCLHERIKLLTSNLPEQEWPIARTSAHHDLNHMMIVSTQHTKYNTIHLELISEFDAAHTRTRVAHHKIALNFVFRLWISIYRAHSKRKIDREGDGLASADQSMLINLLDWNSNSCVHVCTLKDTKDNTKKEEFAIVLERKRASETTKKKQSKTKTMGSSGEVAHTLARGSRK